MNGLLLTSSLADEFLRECWYQAIVHERPNGFFIRLAYGQDKSQGLFPPFLCSGANRSLAISGIGFFVRLLCV